MNTTASTADWFFTKPSNWQSEYQLLRSIAMEPISKSFSLQEEVKWGNPCYTYQGANIVLIHGFKEYCALLFFKGALLNDDKKILIQQTENVQAARQMRFKNVQEIIKQKSTIKSFIKQAIEVEKAGLTVSFKKPAEFKMAAEFKNALDQIPKLKMAFNALTPGRQRAYLLYFSSAKQVKTREDRVKKYIPRILAGKGLDD
jgi:uncharacterized protein YdeI (YjbR/CyaY-like superfamily)